MLIPLDHLHVGRQPGHQMPLKILIELHDEQRPAVVDEVGDVGLPSQIIKPAASESPQLVEGYRGKAASLSGENGFVLNGLGEFSRVDPFSVSLWVRAPASAATCRAWPSARSFRSPIIGSEFIRRARI